MKRIVLSAFIFALAIPVMGQSRVAAIWGVAHDRISHQNDRWFNDGEFPKCIQSLRMLNLAYPESEDIATNLGWLLESTEQNAEALSVYVRFKNNNPTNPNGPYPEADFYYKKSAFAKVPPLLEPTIKGTIKPHGNTYRRLAHAYEKLKRYTDSKRVWEAYLKLNPNDEAAKNNLRRVENKIKDSKQRPVK